MMHLPILENSVISKIEGVSTPRDRGLHDAAF
jgi:hypothetical protein